MFHNIYVVSRHASFLHLVIPPGAAIIGLSSDLVDGQVQFVFEDNAHGKMNLERFDERLESAALKQPMYRPMSVPVRELEFVGIFDQDLGELRLEDAKRLSEWAGEPVTDGPTLNEAFRRRVQSMPLMCMSTFGSTSREEAHAGVSK